MTRKKSMFQCLTPYHSGTITLGWNKKGKITDVGKIVIHPYLSIDNVLFVEGLKQNLLSICQLCDSGYGVSFNKDECVVLCDDGSPIFFAKRKRKPLQDKIGLTLKYKGVMLIVYQRKSLVMA